MINELGRTIDVNSSSNDRQRYLYTWIFILMLLSGLKYYSYSYSRQGILIGSRGKLSMSQSMSKVFLKGRMRISICCRKFQRGSSLIDRGCRAKSVLEINFFNCLVMKESIILTTLWCNVTFVIVCFFRSVPKRNERTFFMSP